MLQRLAVGATFCRYSRNPIYRSSVNEVAPPIMVGGGPFTSPLVVIKKFQTEIWSGPPHHDGGGATSFTDLR